MGLLIPTEYNDPRTSAAEKLLRMRRRAPPYLAIFRADCAQIWCVVPLTHGKEVMASINVTNSTAHARYVCPTCTPLMHILTITGPSWFIFGIFGQWSLVNTMTYASVLWVLLRMRRWTSQYLGKCRADCAQIWCVVQLTHDKQMMTSPTLLRMRGVIVLRVVEPVLRV